MAPPQELSKDDLGCSDDGPCDTVVPAGDQVEIRYCDRHRLSPNRLAAIVDVLIAALDLEAVKLYYHDRPDCTHVSYTIPSGGCPACGDDIATWVEFEVATPAGLPKAVR